MAFKGLDGFLDKLTDMDMWKDAAAGAAGGAAGGLAFQALKKNVAFLGEGSGYTPMLKQAAAGVALAALGASLMEGFQAEAAKGWIGGIGAHLGQMLAKQFAPTAYSSYFEGYDGYGLSDYAALADQYSSHVQLESTRSYSGEDNPANLGRVSVSTPDPAELAALAGTYM